MQRLLQIDSCLGILSTGNISESIAKLAMAQGWECYMLHGARSVGPSVQKHFQVTTKLGTYIHFAKSWFLDKHGLGSVLETKRIVDIIKEIKPDVVQMHCIHGYYINYKILFEYLHEADIPVVWTFHDCWAFTGHCAHFLSANCEKWKTGCFDCPLIHNYPKSLFMDNSKANYEQKKKSFTSVPKLNIVAVSEWLAGLARQSFLKEFPIHVIRNGINLTIYKPIESDIREKYHINTSETMVLGVASAWSNGKGLGDFCKLSQETDIRVVLVGVSNELKEKLPKDIIAIGRTRSQQELVEFYSAADVFVNPTYEDSFPTVNLEALACGTPVITYRTGGSPEAVNENTGVVVEQGDYAELLKQIRIFKNIAFKEHHSVDCRKRAETCFDMHERFGDYIELYQTLLRNK